MTCPCAANADLLARLTDILQQLRDAVAKEGWTVDWAPVDGFLAQAASATQAGNLPDAAREYLHAITHLMAQLRQIRSASSDSGGSKNCKLQKSANFRFAAACPLLIHSPPQMSSGIASAALLRYSCDRPAHGRRTEYAFCDKEVAGAVEVADPIEAARGARTPGLGGLDPFEHRPGGHLRLSQPGQQPELAGQRAAAGRRA